MLSCAGRRIPEFELHRIVTEGHKDVPESTLVELRLGSLTGTVTVRVQFPGQQDWKLYPDLTIRNGTVVLPLKLAFLSHAKEDAAFVRDLAGRLLQDGVLTWFDERDLLPGDDWKYKIDQAIEKSDFVLIFLSSSSVSKTGYFQREMKYALDQRQLRPESTRYLIPIIIDACKPPASFKEIHWLRTDEPEWYDRLLRALAV